MRTLIIIPIIHTERDMGSLLEQVKHEYLTRYGHEKWVEHLQTIEEVWTGIEQIIAALELPYATVRLYQDGLPICDKEAAIVADVARSGSRNHLLITKLIARGATLMGTENAELLVREYQLVKALVSNPKPAPEDRSQLEVDSKALLSERDRFIAARIDDTLRAGEIGLLFLGMAHAVEEHLPSDLLVRHLLPALNKPQQVTAP